MGNNSNGIRGKIDSLKHAINSFHPSCIPNYESKLQGKSLAIPGFKLFFKDRVENSGGAVRIRVINIYGPQEPQTSHERQKALEF